MRFDGILSCQCEKANEKTYEFQISHVYWPFSSDIKAVKGLKKADLDARVKKEW